VLHQFLKAACVWAASFPIAPTDLCPVSSIKTFPALQPGVDCLIDLEMIGVKKNLPQKLSGKWGVFLFSRKPMLFASVLPQSL
jgi:hypothetical protein